MLYGAAMNIDSLPQRRLAEYRRRINRAMNYIAEHLDSNPDLDEIATAANFSKYHFHRLFRALTGESVAGFTRRLRLERAALALGFDRQIEITTLALDLGFSSAQNFAKAFRKHFGCTPSEYRAQNSNRGHPQSKPGNATDAAFGKTVLTLQFSEAVIERSKNMNVEIEQMPERRVAYVRSIGAYGPENCGAAFCQLMQWAGPRGLTGNTQLGIAWDNPDVTPPEKCRYDACVELAEGQLADGPASEQTLPPGQYAVYHAEVVNNDFATAWQAMFADWLPGSGYQPGAGPCFERYLSNGSDHPEGRWQVDICVPVQPL